MWFGRVLRAASWVWGLLAWLGKALKILLDGSLKEMIDAWRIIRVMPDIDNQFAFREWVRAFPRFALAVARITDTEVDDQVVIFISDCVENDLYWDFFYTLVNKIFNDENLPDNIYFMGDDVSYDEEINRLANEAKVSPILVINIVTLILKFIDLIKRR